MRRKAFVGWGRLQEIDRSGIIPARNAGFCEPVQTRDRSWINLEELPATRPRLPRLFPPRSTRCRALVSNACRGDQAGQRDSVPPSPTLSPRRVKAIPREVAEAGVLRVEAHRGLKRRDSAHKLLLLPEPRSQSGPRSRGRVTTYFRSSVPVPGKPVMQPFHSAR